jgi:hypothetical protein
MITSLCLPSAVIAEEKEVSEKSAKIETGIFMQGVLHAPQWKRRYKGKMRRTSCVGIPCWTVLGAGLFVGAV